MMMKKKNGNDKKTGISLISRLLILQKSDIDSLAEKRLAEFSSFSKKSEKEWFYELCFCILAANSRQKTAEKIEKKLGEKLLTMPERELSEFIRENKHRFHNNKAKYIVNARRFSNIKSVLSEKTESDARIWIVENIKGLGFKEASHFLRNTGAKNLAILDRHIINSLSEDGMIEKPSVLTPRIYLEIEKKFINLASELEISPAKLDLFVWYLKTGEILK